MKDFDPRGKVSVVSGGFYEKTPATPLPWLWEPYLAFGAVSILDGDPGVGKSLIAVDLAMRIGMGRPMPDGSGPAINPVTGAPVVTTIFCNSEDSVRNTQLPRLLAAGGEPRTTVFVGGIGEAVTGCVPFRLPDHLRFLASLLTSRESLRGSLIVLDPVMAIFPGLAAPDSAVRTALDPLVRIAAESQCCILLIRHLNKTCNRKSLYRGGGSIGILGACRTGLIAGEHPDDPERRVLAMTKTNLGPRAPSLGYRVVTMPERTLPAVYPAGEAHPVSGEILEKEIVEDRRVPQGPAILWDGLTPVTSEELVASKRDPGLQSGPVADWLRKVLANGPVLATEIEAKAQAEGIGYSTVRAAKTKLNIQSRRTMVEGQPRWEWVLPRSLSFGDSEVEPVELDEIYEQPTRGSSRCES